MAMVMPLDVPRFRRGARPGERGSANGYYRQHCYQFLVHGVVPFSFEVMCFHYMAAPMMPPTIPPTRLAPRLHQSSVWSVLLWW